MAEGCGHAPQRQSRPFVFETKPILDQLTFHVSDRHFYFHMTLDIILPQRLVQSIHHCRISDENLKLLGPASDQIPTLFMLSSFSTFKVQTIEQDFHSLLVETLGIEPEVYCVRGNCSTTELCPQKVKVWDSNPHFPPRRVF